MPIARIAGAKLRSKFQREEAHHDEGDMVGPEMKERIGGLLRDVGMLGATLGGSVTAPAAWVLRPTPTAAGTLEDARSKGYIR